MTDQHPTPRQEPCVHPVRTRIATDPRRGTITERCHLCDAVLVVDAATDRIITTEVTGR